MSAIQKLILSYDEAAERLSISTDTFRRAWIETGKIIPIPVSANRRGVLPSDLQQYILDLQQQERARREALIAAMASAPNAGQKKRGRGRPAKDGRPAGAPKKGRPRKSDLAVGRGGL